MDQLEQCRRNKHAKRDSPCALPLMVLPGDEASVLAQLQLRLRQLEQDTHDKQEQLMRLAEEKGRCLCLAA